MRAVTQIDRNGERPCGHGLVLIGLFGFGIGAMTSISHRLFGGQGFRVWILEVGQDILSLTVMGLILAGWR